MLWGLLIGIAIGFVISSISYAYQTKKRNNNNKMASTLEDNNEHEEEEKQN